MGASHVITAAHCTHGETVASVQVLIGDTSLAIRNDTVRFVRTLAEIRAHPNYDPDLLVNDIAVLVLSEPVNLTREGNL